jgi:hypothetical protein
VEKYTEIPIEKEPKYEHKLRSCCVCEEKEWSYDYLENYYCKKCTKEREKPCYWIPVEKITSHATPVTSYHCPKCDKKLGVRAVKNVKKSPRQKAINRTLDYLKLNNIL